MRPFPSSSPERGLTVAHILLINPPAASVWHLPAGIAYLAGYLEACGHEVIQSYAHIKGVDCILRKADTEMGRALRIVRDGAASISDRYWARMAMESVSRSIKTDDTFRIQRNNVVYDSPFYDGTVEGAIQAIREREKSVWYDYLSNHERKLVARVAPGICGISIGDQRQVVPGFILGSIIKDAFPSIKVVLGGNIWPRLAHAFSLPGFSTLMEMTCDAIVVSEGFVPLNAFASGAPREKISDLAWVDETKLVRVNCGSLAVDFNSLPSPVFGESEGATQWAPDRVVPLYTASNCVKQCGYCDISGGSSTFMKQPRQMDVEHVVRDMVTSGATRFDFTEELLNIDRQIDIGRALRQVGYPATWQCYTTITKDLLELGRCQELADAGCRAVQVGLESLDQMTLARERKGWNRPEQYGQILNNLRGVGIQVHAFIILGIPGESAQAQLQWPAFIKQYGSSLLTIKASRYQLTRLSPEGRFLASGGDPRASAKFAHLAHIELKEEFKPLKLNSQFTYKLGSGMSMKKVDALRDVLEEACRRHWAYGITSTLPWWQTGGDTLGRSSRKWPRFFQPRRASICQRQFQGSTPSLEKGWARMKNWREKSFSNSP